MTAQQPDANTYAMPSNDVLQAVMGVNPQPPQERAQLENLTQLVDQGHYAKEETQALHQALMCVLGAQHPQMQRIARSIRRQEALKNKG